MRGFYEKNNYKNTVRLSQRADQSVIKTKGGQKTRSNKRNRTRIDESQGGSDKRRGEFLKGALCF